MKYFLNAVRAAGWFCLAMAAFAIQHAIGAAECSAGARYCACRQFDFHLDSRKRRQAG